MLLRDELHFVSILAVLSVFLGLSYSPRTYAEEFDGVPLSGELHRVLIDNIEGGDIKGSRDSGKTWIKLGTVQSAIHGKYWRPTQEGGVLAFNFLRGASNVFATAVNALHLRFSDPPGYQLPKDPHAPLIPPHAVSIMPKLSSSSSGVTSDKVVLTDIPTGTSLFGPEWAPRVGAAVYMGDGVNFAPIPYDVAPDTTDPMHSKILIVTPRLEKEIDYLEFRNEAGGKVLIKYLGETLPHHIAKVLQPVEGVGRFEGSEFISKPGVIRANHAGVICFGTTDAQTDPNIPADLPIEERRGGFQVIPSHHYGDASMSHGGDHGFVYMVIGPIIDPPNLIRYDRGIEGRAPLFKNGLRAGGGETLLELRDHPGTWVELNQALSHGLLKRKDGTPIAHLRGIIKDAFQSVIGIRHRAAPVPSTE